MKTLNNYIKESLLDDEEDLAMNDAVLIKQFLKDNYKIDGSYKVKGNIVDINGNIYFNSSGQSLVNKLFTFGVVNGNFDCTYTGVNDLAGAPEIVKGNFNCSECYEITSLIGGPKNVDGDFDCSCTDIKDLTGAPEIVKGNFNCSECSNLKNLKGLPKKIGGRLIISNTPVYRDESIRNELKRKKLI